MKNAAILFLAWIIVTPIFAASPSTNHPLFGEWTWTRKVNNCTETYNYSETLTAKITSGEEVAESRFTITDDPDQNGFYRMTDEVTKGNGKTGCDGTAGGSSIGDKVTLFIFIKPTGDQMVFCSEPSFKSCFGPLRRVKN